MTFPIILAHGVCRFDTLWNKALELDNNDDPRIDLLHYFKGIRTMLKEKGYDVFHSSVSWAASVDKRAEDLKNNVKAILEQSQAEKVNIIAHSMGGLDARHMMFNDRDSGKIHERIASLTTISTPHEGSPFADWGLKNLPKLIPLSRELGLDIEALKDLRVEVCKEFNQRSEVMELEESLEDAIQFQTYAGRQELIGVFNLLQLPFYIIEKEEGENDGLVSVQSAKWKEKYFQSTIDKTDHLNELGWWEVNQFWALETPDELLRRIHALYAEIASRLP